MHETRQTASTGGTRRAATAGEDALIRENRALLNVCDLYDRTAAWLIALILLALALTLRLWGLGTVHELIFDETYYVKDAYTLTQNGVEMSWPEDPNPAFERGEVDTYHHQDGAYVVHPSLGKWLIGLGMMALGPESAWGWRISVAILGSLSVPMLMLITRRLFRSTMVGAIAGLLLAIDGMHIVQSRTSLLDLPLMFFALAGFGALLIDRDRSREILAVQAARLQAAGQALDLRTGLRPWRITAGVLLGMACAVKWSGLYFLAVFGIMTVLWDWWARRRLAEPQWASRGLVREAIPAFLQTVGTAFLVYIASWAGWFASDLGHKRHWASEEGRSSGIGAIDALRSLWEYHREAYTFHVGLNSEHTYQANPLLWPLMLRPTNYYYRSYEFGQKDCLVAECSSHILAVGNPLIWWFGSLAVIAALILGLIWRDGRALAALTGIIGGYLPWLMYMDRTIFTFYAVVFEPWLIMCLACAFGLLIGPLSADRDRRLAGALFATSLLTLIVLVSAFLWPIWSGQVIDHQQWQWRMWLPGWT